MGGGQGTEVLDGAGGEGLQFTQLDVLLRDKPTLKGRQPAYHPRETSLPPVLCHSPWLLALSPPSRSSM